jgi:hypothetical protein
LPGPRGNLELLYSFTKTASESEINECLSFYKDDLSNCPEEFVMMCGIVGFCIFHQKKLKEVFEKIRPYASHSSWRIREAVAIGIQQIAKNNMNEIINTLKIWSDGNDLEKRAVIATLCEPDLLKEKVDAKKVLELLTKITLEFENYSKLSDNQTSLRKTLGYGWSVLIVALPVEGKIAFESIAKKENKHIKWIVKEILKKIDSLKWIKNGSKKSAKVSLN